MLTYQSNSDAESTRSWVWPSWDYHPVKVQSRTLRSPTPVTLSYDPHQEQSWRHFPLEEESFANVKQHRLIKMTPLSVGKVTTDRFVASHPRKAWGANLLTAFDATEDPCSPRSWSSGPLTSAISYDEFATITNLGIHDHFKITDLKEGEVLSALESVSADVVKDLHSDVDLLTELAEFPEVMKLILNLLRTVRSPLKGIADLQERYKRASKRDAKSAELTGDLADEWLQYRYGIMPIVYSIRSLIDLLNSKGVEFKTERGRKQIDLNASADPGIENSTYLFDEVKGSVSVSAVGKMRYGNDSSRLLDQISFNPFLTAWELIPFSFVIDWFINVGNVLSAHTSALFSSAQQRRFCRSVRKKYAIDTYYRRHTVDSFYLDVPSRSEYSTCNDVLISHPVDPGHVWDERFESSTTSLVQRVTQDSYDRSLFHPSDASLSFSPSLNWMREVDALALSLRKVLF